MNPFRMPPGRPPHPLVVGDPRPKIKTSFTDWIIGGAFISVEADKLVTPLVPSRRVPPGPGLQGKHVAKKLYAESRGGTLVYRTDKDRMIEDEEPEIVEYVKRPREHRSSKEKTEKKEKRKECSHGDSCEVCAKAKKDKSESKKSESKEKSDHKEKSESKKSDSKEKSDNKEKSKSKDKSDSIDKSDSKDKPDPSGKSESKHKDDKEKKSEGDRSEKKPKDGKKKDKEVEQNDEVNEDKKVDGKKSEKEEATEKENKKEDWQKKAGGGKGKEWTKEEDDMIRSMKKANKSTKEIVAALKRPKKAITTRWEELEKEEGDNANDATATTSGEAVDGAGGGWNVIIPEGFGEDVWVTTGGDGEAAWGSGGNDTAAASGEAAWGGSAVAGGGGGWGATPYDTVAIPFGEITPATNPGDANGTSKTQAEIDFAAQNAKTSDANAHPPAAVHSSAPPNNWNTTDANGNVPPADNSFGARGDSARGAGGGSDSWNKPEATAANSAGAGGAEGFNIPEAAERSVETDDWDNYGKAPFLPTSPGNVNNQTQQQHGFSNFQGQSDFNNFDISNSNGGSGWNGQQQNHGNARQQDNGWGNNPRGQNGFNHQDSQPQHSGHGGGSNNASQHGFQNQQDGWNGSQHGRQNAQQHDSPHLVNHGLNSQQNNVGNSWGVNNGSQQGLQNHQSGWNGRKSSQETHKNAQQHFYPQSNNGSQRHNSNTYANTNVWRLNDGNQGGFQNQQGFNEVQPRSSAPFSNNRLGNVDGGNNYNFKLPQGQQSCNQQTDQMQFAQQNLDHGQFQNSPRSQHSYDNQQKPKSNLNFESPQPSFAGGHDHRTQNYDMYRYHGKRLRPDNAWSAHDCEVLESMYAQHFATSWMQMQARFYNLTHRMVSGELIARKFERG